MWSAAFIAGGLTAFAAHAQDMPRDDIEPLVDIDWSVGLRGAYMGDSVTGPSYQGIIAPEISLSRPNANGSTSLSSGAEVSIDQDKRVRIDDLHAGAAADFQLDEYTKLNGNLDLSLTQGSPTDTSLPVDTAVAPREFTGTATGSAERKLGQFTLTGTLKGQRFIEGPTTLDDSSTVDNSDLSYWLGSATLRDALEFTPRVALFVEGSAAYQKFDAPSPTLLTFEDGRTLTLRGGVSFTQEGTLTAEASLGRSWIDYRRSLAHRSPGLGLQWQSQLYAERDADPELIARYQPRPIDGYARRHRCRLHYQRRCQIHRQSVADPAGLGQLGSYGHAGQWRHQLRL